MIVRKVIYRLLLITLLIGVITAAIIKFIPSDDNHYMLAVKDKHARLDSISSPKIIIIGGSNTAFGIDSQMIEDSLHMPVANMGIHVGLGLEYMINEVKSAIQKGDIVIMIPEYSLLFSKTESGENDAFYKTLEGYPNAINYINSKNKVSSILNGYVAILQSKLKSQLFDSEAEQQAHVKRNQFIYKRKSYNHRGDMTAHLSMSTQEYNKEDDDFSSFKNRKISDFFLALTNEIYTFTETRDASFVMSFAPTPESIFEKETGKSIYTSLSEKAKYPIITKPHDVVFPDSMFFDTRYHLLKESRSERTALLIARLKAMN